MQNVAHLSAHNLSKTFMQGTVPTQVLNDITVDFVSSTTYAITGASGTGKSTLLHLLGGLDRPSSGTVTFNEQSITAMSPAQLTTFWNRSLGLAFQLPYLINELSVIENIMLKALAGGQSYDACRQAAQSLLQAVGLHIKAESKPSTLSGGQQQRVAILRALCTKPAFLLADEPTGNLDATTAREVIDFIVDCRAQWGMGLIISTHDMAVACRMEVVMQIHEGKLSVHEVR